MDTELATLEEKISPDGTTVSAAARRKRGLRQQLAALQGDKRQLAERSTGRRSRLETLLKQIPE